MIIPDVNLLLYAVITGFPHHARARQWWEDSLNGTARVGLTLPAVLGFLRIATSGRVLEAPLPVDQAVGYVEDWLARSNVELLTAGRDHLRHVFALVQEVGTAGNLTTDAQLAAYALEHRGQVYSNDADFGRFSAVSWVNPLR